MTLAASPPQRIRCVRLPRPGRAGSPALCVSARGLACLLLLLMLPTVAFAQARAWLDRDRIAAGETATLNIESTEDGTSAPDFSPLQRDFVVSGNTSRREFQMHNGRATVRALYGVALRPRRDGVLTIPALTVGTARTAPLTLVVAPTASAAPAPARAGDDLFIESGPDDASPYVQQAVGWVVRLYSAVPLVSGQLDQPAPEGATLQRIGEDAQYTRDVGGRRYLVIERRFLLLPERSGALTLPGASFEGRGTGGFFDDLLGDRGGALSVQARARVLQVRAPPANAPSPWLPLHGLELRYRTTPRVLREGAAADLVVELTADGATAAQLPPLNLPMIDGVQVFADPVKTDETFVNGRPQVKQVRRFSLVPVRAGAISVPPLELAWWDVGTGTRKVASVPSLRLESLPAPEAANVAGTQVQATPPSVAATPRASARNDVVRGLRNPWVVATVVFASLWLLTLFWWLGHRGGHAPGAVQRESGADPVPATGPRSADTGALRHALDTGTLADVVDALAGLAPAPCTHVDQLRDQLADPHQREAVDLLQRARWSDGDGRAARAALRDAFAKGPHWRAAAPVRGAPLLPPLYPDH